MTQLVWDDTGKRLFETGVDRCVLYVMDNNGAYPLGMAWNGLTGVTESPSGAEPSPLYGDNIKYLTLMSAEDFSATLEAFTYPEEFGECDGTKEIGLGLGGLVSQQPRKKFGLVYRTKLGNDVAGDSLGYKLHLLYGCQASPSEKAYATINDSPEAITFSWEVNTTPTNLTGFQPTSLIVIDSTQCVPAALTALENQLFGDTGITPNLPFPDAVKTILEDNSWLNVSLPVGWTWDPLPFTIQRQGLQGSIFRPYNWDVSAMQPVTTASLYVSPSGDDGNNGATLPLAKRTIENAIGAMTQPTTIFLNDGLYGEASTAGQGGWWRGANPAYSLIVKAINSGEVVHSGHIFNLGWALYHAPSNTYSVAYANTVMNAWDSSVLVDGDYTRIVPESSIVNVQTNPGTFYQTGGVLYLHLFDGRVPDADVHIMREMQAAYCNRDSITIYLEGIEFQAGVNGACYFRNNSAVGGLNVYAKNCKFKYSAATGGFAMEGTDLSIVQNCIASRNQNDGYNYHVRNGIIPKAIEINCIGRYSGLAGGDSDNNGSSMHDGGKVLRILGQYHNSYGPVVIDIGNAQSWNLGSEAHHGLVNGQSNFYIDGTMWVDSGWSHDRPAAGYDVQVLGAGDAFYYRDLNSGGVFLNGGGTIATY